MPSTEDFASQLPSLRRFAHALTGTAHMGDAYAFVTLQAILEDRPDAPRSLDSRAIFLRALIAIWLPMAWNFMGCESAKSRLDTMAPLSRAAFLLHTMERLSSEEIAGILDTTVQDAAQLLGFVTEQSRGVARDAGETVRYVEFGTSGSHGWLSAKAATS